MNKVNDGGPAFPCETVGADEHGEYRLPWQGMTLRQYAAIKLRVPNSGTDWLDEMIRTSLRDEFAAKAMQGMWASDTEAWHCSGTKDALASRAIYTYAMADAMLAVRDPAPVQASKAPPNLIAAAPELLEALREAVDLAWTQDSHQVQFDSTVVFSPSYDFSGLDGCSRIEFLGQHECIVWRSGGKWSAYCTYEGSTWFEQFNTAEEAKEQCMRLLDKVLPDHPAMRARASIAKATGATHA